MRIVFKMEPAPVAARRASIHVKDLVASCHGFPQLVPASVALARKRSKSPAPRANGAIVERRLSPSGKDAFTLLKSRISGRYDAGATPKQLSCRPRWKRPALLRAF
jgi:hypothetical protein